MRQRAFALAAILSAALLAGLAVHRADADPRIDAAPATRLARGMAVVEAMRDRDRRSAAAPPTRPFAERYDGEVFARRARRHLAKTSLLEGRWGVFISDEELQDELDRIARETRRPERLRQIFAALDHDADRIAEVLVRPHLVDRRLRALYAEETRDAAKKARPFDEWLEEQGLAAGATVSWASGLRLPKVLGSGSDEPDSWTLELPEGPQAKRGQSAVWTGSELIVWGGAVPGPPSDGLWTNAGFVYDPVTDVWSPIRLDSSTPSPRAFHAAVWTGAKMIIWGGESWSEEASPPYFVGLDTGGVYDPVEDRWVATPSDGAPSARVEPSAVWTGSEMIIWGGLVPSSGGAMPPPPVPDYTPLSDGARFDPGFGGWTSMGGTPPSARGRGAAVWTGDVMLVVGGFTGTAWISPQTDPTAFASYDPATDAWDTTLVQPPSGGPMSPPFEAPKAVWTGESLWVAQPASGKLVARYSGGAWSEPPPPPSTGDRRYSSVVWTGRRLILWGGISGMPGAESILGSGLIYDTQGAVWSTIPATASSPLSRFGHFGVWTGAEMLIWGGARVIDPDGGPARPANVVSSGGRLTPNWATPADGGAWQAMPEPPVAAGRGHTAVWTGSEMIVWGGESADPLDQGVVYDPLLDVWSETTTIDAPAARGDHTAVWTGSEMIVWGGLDAAGAPLDSGGRYDPVADSWTATGGTPPAARSDHTAVWADDEMIVWGGLDAVGGGLASGALYDPDLDQWTATSASPLAARALHTALWTGDDMVVFGGLAGCPAGCSPANDAALYDPSTDAWSSTFAPPGDDGHRFAHTAVWTGDDMIAWGGTGTYDDANPCLNDGVAIDPAAMTAALMTASGDGRCHHTAIWNGAEMIVWGGADRVNVTTGGGVPPETPLSSGARLDPEAGIWTATRDDATTIPAAQRHVALWTGEEMLIWGGRPEISGALGVYYTDTVPTASPTLEIDGVPGSTVLLGGVEEAIGLGHDLPSAFFDDVEGSSPWTAGSEAAAAPDAKGAVGSPWNISVAGGCSDGGDYVSPIRAWRFGEPGTCHYHGDDGTFTLTSDDTLTFTSSTLLVLRYLLGTDQVGNSSEQDSARIEVSTDDGATWTVIAIDRLSQEGGAAPAAAPLDDTGAGWRGLSLAVADFVGATSEGRIRFVFERQGSLDDGIGWLIDDITIGEPAGDGRLPGGSLTASDGSVAQHRVAAHDLWDRPSFSWDLDGDGLADNPDPDVPGFDLVEGDLAAYGLDQPGQYDLELTVSDLAGQSDSATVTLEVVDGEAPTVKVLSPNGGEAWSAESTQTVTWSASDNIGLLGFDLAYYDDEAGTGPIPINDELLDAGARSHTWTLPAATSTAMRVEITAYDQRPAPGGPNTAVDTSDAPFYIVQANSDEIRTLIVWHRDRFADRFSDADAGAVAAGIANLAAHVKVDGQVLDLANVPSLDPLYDAWDATAWATGTTDDLDDNIAQAQAVAAAVRNYLFEQISQSFTHLESLILIGADSSIPFWRMAEDLPRYPESNYIAELQSFGFLDDASSPAAFCDETESPLMAAICRDHYLADTPYGASTTTAVPGSSFTWWLPDLAVGRMVETPAQILGLIDVFIAQDGVTVVDHALTTGYDFLTDGGDAVQSLLQSELDLGTTTVDRLSQAVSLWSDDDLLERLFGVPPTAPSDLTFVSGHADHRAEGAAQTGDAGILTTEEMAASGIFNRGGVLVAVGCHSALPVEADGGAVDETDPAFLLDLPELLASRSFPAMIGNGGYGWGFSEGIGLGEQLMLLIAEEITGAGQISLGEALRLAKQEYFLRQSRLDAFDHKVLHESMLFGIPNYEVRVDEAASALAPTLKPSLGDGSWQQLELGKGRRLSKAPVVEVARPRALGSDVEKGLASLRVLDFTYQAYEQGQDTDSDPGTADWQEAYAQFDWCTDATGESILCTGAAGETSVGTYFTLDGVASVESGRPIQPMISFDSRLFGTELHGVLIRGGEVVQPAAINPEDPSRCTDELGTVHPCFDPVIGNPETEEDEDEGPAPTPFINLDTPTPFINLDTPTPNGFTSSSSGGGRFDTLNAPMGVTVRRGVRDDAGEREEIFSQWLYRTREFTNYYSSSADWDPPVIGDFTADCEDELTGDDCFHTLSDKTATFDVPVTDAGDGVYRVFVTYTEDVDASGYGAWQTLELLPTAADRFGAVLELERTAYYLVQAVDWAGNIGTVAVSGDDVDATGNPIGSTFEAPRLFTISLPEELIFTDGFESGNLTAWTTASP